MPDSLYGLHENSIPAHSDIIFCSVCSSEYSLDAAAPMFSRPSIFSSTPQSTRFWSDTGTVSS